jgi:hypothetical protein
MLYDFISMNVRGRQKQFVVIEVKIATTPEGCSAGAGLRELSLDLGLAFQQHTHNVKT